MKSIEEIVEISGGWDRLRHHPLRIEVEGFMALHSEIVGHQQLLDTQIPGRHRHRQRALFSQVLGPLADAQPAVQEAAQDY
jgi:hypothetical protein